MTDDRYVEISCSFPRAVPGTCMQKQEGAKRRRMLLEFQVDENATIGSKNGVSESSASPSVWVSEARASLVERRPISTLEAASMGQSAKGISRPSMLQAYVKVAIQMQRCISQNTIRRKQAVVDTQRSFARAQLDSPFEQHKI